MILNYVELHSLKTLYYFNRGVLLTQPYFIYKSFRYIQPIPTPILEFLIFLILEEQYVNQP